MQAKRLTINLQNTYTYVSSWLSLRNKILPHIYNTISMEKSCSLGKKKFLYREKKISVSRGNLRPKSWDVCFKPWNVYPKAWDVNFKAWDIKYVGKKELLSPDINLVTPRHRKTRESNAPFYRSSFEASRGDKINHL